MKSTKTKVIAAVCSGLMLVILTGCARVETSDLVKNVDVYIGTGGHGHAYMGPSVPFGAIKPGPSNHHQGWDWCSGYHYSDSILIGFSHLHLNGTGCTDLGDILIMPYTGPVVTHKGEKDNPDAGYASRYSHQRETATPYYYAVTLDDYKVDAELTATERVAMHRYKFPADQTARIIIDLEEGNGDQAVETYITKIDHSTLGGYRFSTGWAKDQRVYFAISVQAPIEQFEVYDGGTKLADTFGKSDKIKGVLSFSPRTSPILLKVAISPVSIENAQANMKIEVDHWDFQKISDQARQKWNSELSKIKIDSDSSKINRTFYTALYHSMISPLLYNDSNGDYLGTDKKVYKNPGFQNYSVFSLWDTYRTEHPLLTIIQPDRVSDMIKSMLAIHHQQGNLPIWHLMGNETWTMVGYHAVPVIVDAYFKGIGGFDPEEAFQAIKQTAMADRAGLQYLKEFGYIPADKEKESVAKALEYAIDDACIAMMAKALGKTEDYNYFLKRSQSYSMYFDAQTQFMRGRMADGSWRTPFDPIASAHRADDYCEGNAWQYVWLVPHDPAGLVKLFGSEEAFIAKLDQLFALSSDLGEGASVDITGLIGQYAHGNEPGHHITYLYPFVGQQWKTAQKVRYIMANLYDDKPDGLCGNEDCGQMSAWYIMSALGFYPVHPANGVYVLGSPIVNRAVIPLPGGKEFVIEVKDNSDKNIYIQSMIYNGKPYGKGFITHKMITDGGRLTFQMGPEPNKAFAADPADRP